MALTRATKAKRLASLDADIKDAQRVAKAHEDRADAAQAKAAALAKERAWLAMAPVADPLPAEGLAGGDQA